MCASPRHAAACANETIASATLMPGGSRLASSYSSKKHGADAVKCFPCLQTCEPSALALLNCRHTAS